MEQRRARRSDEELLNDLRMLLARRKRLSTSLINQEEGMACAWTYHARFHGMANAYRLIGYHPSGRLRCFRRAREFEKLAERLRAEMTSGIEAGGGMVVRDAGLLIVNREISISVQVLACTANRSGSFRWKSNMRTLRSLAKIIVAVRMDAENESPLDYFLFPAEALEAKPLLLKEENGFAIEAFRFDSLKFLLGMGRRTTLAEIL